MYTGMRILLVTGEQIETNREIDFTSVGYARIIIKQTGTRTSVATEDIRNIYLIEK